MVRVFIFNYLQSLSKVWYHHPFLIKRLSYTKEAAPTTSNRERVSMSPKESTDEGKDNNNKKV